MIAQVHDNKRDVRKSWIDFSKQQYIMFQKKLITKTYINITLNDLCNNMSNNHTCEAKFFNSQKEVQ